MLKFTSNNLLVNFYLVTAPPLNFFTSVIITTVFRVTAGSSIPILLTWDLAQPFHVSIVKSPRWISGASGVVKLCSCIVLP